MWNAKYNSAGVFQWIYNTPYDTNNGDWLGALATDNAGNSYVTRGSSAAISKINTTGGVVYSVNGGAFDEYWQISFNCDFKIFVTMWNIFMKQCLY